VVFALLHALIDATHQMVDPEQQSLMKEHPISSG
jgi:hypothetical protein